MTEDEKLESEEPEEVEEEEEEEETEPDANHDKTVVEGLSYLGGLLEDFVNTLTEQLDRLQESVDKINTTLETIKNLKQEQMTLIQTPEEPSKGQTRSTLSETAKRIKEQQIKKEGGANDGKRTGKGGRPPGKRGSSETAGTPTERGNGGTASASEQPLDGSTKPDMGKMSPDTKSKDEPRE